MKRHLLHSLIAIVLIISASCSSDIFGPDTEPLGDPRLNGMFSFYESKEGWSQMTATGMSHTHSMEQTRLPSMLNTGTGATTAGTTQGIILETITCLTTRLR